MRYRTSDILAAKDLGAAGTETIDLKGNKPLSRIVIAFTTTKVLKYMTAPGPANIQKVEIVAGNRVLYSATGYEIQAAAYYNRPGTSQEMGQHIGTQAELDHYSLDFGRHLWDPRYAFIPGRFENPQLKITWNEALADTSVVANSCQVRGLYFDEREISPLGFLSLRQWIAGTFGSSGSYVEVDLPTDRLLRQMFIRAYQDGYEPWYQMAAAKLDENGGDKIVFSEPDMELYHEVQKLQVPAVITPLVIEPSDTARVFYIPQTDFWATVNLMNVAINKDIFVSGASLKGGKLTIDAAGESQAVGQARGYLPWHTFRFPFGVPEDPEDWYDPKGKAPHLQLKANTGGTSGTYAVTLEQVEPY